MVRPRYGIDKCKAEAMSARLPPLDPSFEQMRKNLRIEPRPIVFKNERCAAIVDLQFYRHGAGCGKMLEFVIEQIGNHAMNQRRIRRNDQGTAAAKSNPQTSFRQIGRTARMGS